MDRATVEGLCQLAEAIASIADLERVIRLLERYENGDMALEELVDSVQALCATMH